MNEKLISEIINALPGVLVGAFITYLFLCSNFALTCATNALPNIWNCGNCWKTWRNMPAPKELTFADLEKLTASLREWYFQKGGLFLSDNSRDSYFDLQESIKKVLANHTEAKEQTVPETIYKELRQTGSSLRTALVRDVGTRQEAKLN